MGHTQHARNVHAQCGTKSCTHGHAAVSVSTRPPPLRPSSRYATRWVAGWIAATTQRSAPVTKIYFIRTRQETVEHALHHTCAVTRVQRSALAQPHSLTSLQFILLHDNSLHFISPHFTSNHFTKFHVTSLHLNSLCFISIQFTSLLFNALHHMHHNTPRALHSCALTRATHTRHATARVASLAHHMRTQ